MSLYDDFKEHELEFKKSLKMVTLYSLISSLCMLALPMFMIQVYGKVLISKNLETLTALGLFAFLILSLYGFFDAMRLLVLAKGAVKLEAKMAGPVLAAELSRQSDTSPQTVRDLMQLRQAFSSPGFASIFDLPTLPLFLGIIYIVHPVLGIAVTVGAVLIVIIGMMSDRAVAPLTEKAMEKTVKSHQTLEMHIGSQEIIRAQGMYREVVGHWGRDHGKALSYYLANFIKTQSFSSASKSVRQIIQISIIGMGAVLVLNGLAEPGVIFAAAIISGRALQPIDGLVAGWRQLKMTRSTYAQFCQRLKELSLPDDRTKLPRPKGRIDIERIIYMPKPGAKPIIREIAGAVPAGESVAIIGPSGAGKSTFAKILVGYLEPSSGAINLDGQDIKTWDPVAKGLHIGYMPQQVSFFEATIRENIARLRLQDPPEYAIAAAKMAGVHDLIMKMPEGYDTVISRGGFWPSGGQSQLIALARAFYGDPSVLVLDEPNAALDTAGEQILHQALTRARERGTTFIVITQRPSILNFVEKVMLLQDGTVKEYGPKDQVMKSGAVTTGAQQKKPVPVKPVAANSQTDEKPAAPANSDAPSQPTAEKTAEPASKVGKEA